MHVLAEVELRASVAVVDVDEVVLLDDGPCLAEEGAAVRAVLAREVQVLRREQRVAKEQGGSCDISSECQRSMSNI